MSQVLDFYAISRAIDLPRHDEDTAIVADNAPSRVFGEDLPAGLVLAAPQPA